MEVARREDVVRQIVCIMQCPSYTNIAPLVASAGLLCLAYSPSTHPYLAKQWVIEELVRACEMERPWVTDTPEDIEQDDKLLR